MKKIRTLIIILIIAVGAFLAGSWSSRRQAAKESPGGTETSAVQPGEEAEIDESSLLPGTVSVMPEKQQLIGLRVGAVEKAPVSHTLRLLGRVAADEVRVYKIVASVDGWIQEANDNSVGTLVKKGEVLATFYSPQFLDVEQAHIYALDAVDRLQLGRRLELGRKEVPALTALDQLNVQRQIDILRSMGMDDSQIEEIGKTRQITLEIRIHSPAVGFITERNVSPGQKFLKGTELFQITDLSRVWILADVFEQEVQYFKPGVKAAIQMPYQKRTYEARVSEVLPIFDAATRTLKVRLVTDNPGYLLKPDMFVDVELPVGLPPSVTVPADAILYSGVRKTVFVDRGHGYFEPRRVETGWRLGDRVEIVSGLEPGEKIVLSGNFFLDSESRLQSIAQGIYGAMSLDPVCGMEVDEARAKAMGLTSVYEGKTFYFCSKECKDQFDKRPEKYVEKPSEKRAELNSPK
jgi:Cu(I)/Ag(I) efflux system membrane fusion protein